MMFRKITAAAAAASIALTLTGCAGARRVDGMFGKTLTYEKGGFPDKFDLRIDSDGTFSYYEGFLSSYMGMGYWELNGDTLILREMSASRDAASDVKRVNRFKVGDNGLTFIAEGSDNFIYIDVSDGENFYITDDTNK